MAVHSSEGTKTLFVVSKEKDRNNPEKDHHELQDFIGITELAYRKGALNKRWNLEKTHPLWTDETRSNEESEKYPKKISCPCVFLRSWEVRLLKLPMDPVELDLL